MERYVQLEKKGKGAFMRNWKRKLILAAAVLLLITSSAACSQKPKEESSMVSSEISDPTLFAEGTSIGGKNISGKTVEEALKIAREAMEENMKTLEITVKFKDDTVSLSKEDFQVKETLELTLPRLLEERKAEDHKLPYVVDLSESGRKKLEEAAKACLVKGQNASIASFDSSTGVFQFTEEKSGSRADMVTTLKSVRQLLSQKQSGAIQTTFLETKPELTKKYQIGRAHV